MCTFWVRTFVQLVRLIHIVGDCIRKHVVTPSRRWTSYVAPQVFVRHPFESLFQAWKTDHVGRMGLLSFAFIPFLAQGLWWVDTDNMIFIEGCQFHQVSWAAGAWRQLHKGWCIWPSPGELKHSEWTSYHISSSDLQGQNTWGINNRRFSVMSKILKCLFLRCIFDSWKL